MRWWSSPSSCPASTVCVCFVQLRCWYKEAILLQISLQSLTHHPPHPTPDPHDRHADLLPGRLIAWSGSLEQVKEMVCVCVWHSNEQGWCWRGMMSLSSQSVIDDLTDTSASCRTSRALWIHLMTYLSVCVEQEDRVRESFPQGDMKGSKHLSSRCVAKVSM